MLARRLARLSLLIAAVLQFASTAAGPLAHHSIPPPQPAAMVDGKGGEAPDPPQPHDELSCVLCHSLVAVVVPMGHAVPVPLLSAEPRTAERPVAHGVGSPLLPSARAPPLV